MFDALVMGSGPAGLSISASLCNQGLEVVGVTPTDPDAVLPNTYGIWCDELEALGLTDLLAHRWSDCVCYPGHREIQLGRDYGFLDNRKLQAHLLAQCDRGQMVWHKDKVAKIEHFPTHSCVTTEQGADLSARIVIDATGHRSPFTHRPASDKIAYQAAYGIVGKFSQPPVKPKQLVLMDYRSDHLSPAERAEPPTFLYAMDLGEDVYFVEETSLAHCPPIGFDVLKNRLERRLSSRGAKVRNIHYIERCLFPMNLPLPILDRPVVPFGAAASMVHPASGYLVGATLRRAPAVAQAIARALATGEPAPMTTAGEAWDALWPSERLRKYYFYQFGLENLMQFSEADLQSFFASFFRLSLPQWSGFLTDSLSTPELIVAMLNLFRIAPNNIRQGLLGSIPREGHWLWRALTV
ncbi:lycopene beta cyclase [Phormidium sp. CCY1219]|uniref:lycopene beta cyclase n=1 Tax=Phormidium sp. CCY1219 TaxID=2886104 RepID=UPI002D1E6151|nr:lycopene cyclase family protein [Phormidium sp. CCY1219]MEB3830931.1 lycopene cyclase family protein [Phormidium sp. CCY1219]